MPYARLDLEYVGMPSHISMPGYWVLRHSCVSLSPVFPHIPQRSRNLFDSDHPICNKVFILLSLATGQIITAAVWVHQTLIENFGKLISLDEVPVVALVQLYIMWLLFFFTQSFFVYRIWNLSGGNYWNTLPPAILSTTTLCLSFYVTGRLQAMGHFALIFSINDHIIASAVLAVICDGSVTFNLTYLLHQKRSHSRVKATNIMISKILVYILNRGGFNFMLTAIELTLYLHNNRSMLFLLPLYPGGQITTIAVLSTLLTRKSIREQVSRQAHSVNLTSGGNTAGSTTLNGSSSGSQLEKKGKDIDIEMPTIPEDVVPRSVKLWRENIGGGHGYEGGLSKSGVDTLKAGDSTV
ncbi:hypothetical protein VKT23_006417 [Stygiomarasmius scandens]|uniref:DUF6534 domain-containing protein n=1 Tax=Marasmiellus scandens TaxID=2682957 RepID=A0ABR1JNN0_9AGAR